MLLIVFALVYRWADSRADPPMVSIPRLAATVDPDDAATRSDSGEKEDSLRKAGLEQPMAPNGATLSDPTVEEPSAAENDAAQGPRTIRAVNWTSSRPASRSRPVIFRPRRTTSRLDQRPMNRWWALVSQFLTNSDLTLARCQISPTNGQQERLLRA